MRHDLQHLLWCHEHYIHPKGALKSVMTLKGFPVGVISQEEVSPTAKLRVGRLLIYSHLLIESLKGLDPVLTDANIHFRAELLANTPCASRGGRILVGRVLLQDGHSPV